MIVGFISPHRCCSFEVFRNGASKNHGVLGVQEALPSYAGRCRRLLRRRRWSTRRSGASVSGGRRSHAFPMEDASGKHRKSDGKSPFLVGKPRNSMISMVIFNSNLLSEGPCWIPRYLNETFGFHMSPDLSLGPSFEWTTQHMKRLSKDPLNGGCTRPCVWILLGTDIVFAASVFLAQLSPW